MSHKKILPTKEKLLSIYTSNKSISKTAKIFNTSNPTVRKWLDQYSIPRYSQQEASFFDIEQKKSLIRKKFSFSCINDTIQDLSSVGQNEITEFIRSLGIIVEKNDRTQISPMELDIYIPCKRIAIEYCGVYHHSETYSKKHRKYHYNKMIECRKKGITLLTIFDSDWINKREIVKSIIKHKLGLTEYKIYARNCIIKQLSYKEIKDFEEDNHIQGSKSAKYYFGLYHINNNDLVMTASIGKSRFNKSFQYELLRMTGKQNYYVVGGVSKILEYIRKHIKTSFITYCDNRFGDGRGYLQAGLIEHGESSPNYFYFKKNESHILYSRNKFMKHKIQNVNKSLSEYENMLLQGYDRIWDCGNSIFIKP